MVLPHPARRGQTDKIVSLSDLTSEGTADTEATGTGVPGVASQSRALQWSVAHPRCVVTADITGSVRKSHHSKYS